MHEADDSFFLVNVRMQPIFAQVLLLGRSWPGQYDRYFYYKRNTDKVVNVIRRYWIFGLIIAMVALHATIIVMVRDQLAQIKTNQGEAVDMGEFQFQTVDDKSRVYQARLYAILDAPRSIRGRMEMEKNMATLAEVVGQQLRQAEKPWLADPTHLDLKDHLLQELTKSLSDDFVESLVITHWLELPVPSGRATATGSLASK